MSQLRSSAAQKIRIVTVTKLHACVLRKYVYGRLPFCSRTRSSRLQGEAEIW